MSGFPWCSWGSGMRCGAGDRRLRLGFVIWGLGMYPWSAVLYLLQVRLVVRALRRVGTGRSAAPMPPPPDRALGGYDPRAGCSPGPQPAR